MSALAAIAFYVTFTFAASHFHTPPQVVEGPEIKFLVSVVPYAAAVVAAPTPCAPPRLL